MKFDWYYILIWFEVIVSTVQKMNFNQPPFYYRSEIRVKKGRVKTWMHVYLGIERKEVNHTQILVASVDYKEPKKKKKRLLADQTSKIPHVK